MKRRAGKLVLRSYLAQAQRVISFLDKWGIDPSGQCRLRTLAKGVVKGEDNIIRSDRKDFALLINVGQRDLAEVNFVLDILGEERVATEFGDKLRLLLKDPTHPHDAEVRSPGRDHQLEFFVHAMALRAGLRPLVMGSGADLRTHLGHTVIAVESKRLKSLEQLGKRIAEAATQVEASGVPGVVCVDLSQALADRDQLIVVDPQMDLGKRQHMRFEYFLSIYRPTINAAIRDSAVISTVFIDFFAYQRGVPKPRSTTGDWYLMHCMDHVPRTGGKGAAPELALRWWNEFSLGMPGGKLDPALGYFT